MSGVPERLLERLKAFRQEHLLAFWDTLDETARATFVRQLEETDFECIRSLVQGQNEAPNWHDLAARAQPPQAIRLSAEGQGFSPNEARLSGESALREGKVGMILVAGGQGTRLGFPHPKGMFPLGPISQRTLFQLLIDRLLAVARRYGVRIPLYLMTSPATHAETVSFLQQHRQFGLPQEDLVVFCQGVMPAVDARSFKVLLAGPGSLVLGPDGHGGMLAALDRSGGLADARRRGLAHLFYGQVDNPLLPVCDPLLIGYHCLARAEMTTQVVRKQDPLDRVGNVAVVDGQMRVIEYSDLPEEIARRRNPDGSLYLWAGSIAIHVFDVEFLARVARQAALLPFHQALKKAGYLGSDGRLVEPTSPNAIKFERFIFDLLPAAQNPLVVEASADEVFAALKNAADATTETLQTAQAAMIRRDAALLRASGVVVDEGVPVEVNPRWALDPSEVARRLEPGQRIRAATYFNVTD